MSVRINDVADQIQTKWSGLFSKELREKTLLPGLVNREYEGEIKKGGDTVRVSQINAPTADLLTIGTDADSFGTKALSKSYVDIQVNKRIVAAFEFEDLVEIQSQIDSESSDIRDALKFAVEKKLNDYLYSLVNPSTSSPDHLLNSISVMDKAQLAAIRLLAATAKWDKTKPWFLLADPSYYSDVLADTTLSDSRYGASDAPMIQGRTVLPRMGFNIMEDDSRTVDTALAFHPDFMHLVMGTPRFKISDLHGQKKFGHVISVDVLVGAVLGINGNVKHIKILAA